MPILASTMLRQLYEAAKKSTTTDHDWRDTTGYTSDDMFAIDSLESPDDFSGRALIYPSVKDSVPFNIDIFIQSIQLPIMENLVLKQAIGNIFLPRAFGMKAAEATVSGFIADYKDNYDKTSLVDTYKNYLRMEAVARRGQAPVLVYPHVALVFAATSLNMNKSSDNIDLVAFSLGMYVLQATYMSGDTSVTFDYLHSKEVNTVSNVQVVATAKANQSQQAVSPDIQVEQCLK